MFKKIFLKNCFVLPIGFVLLVVIFLLLRANSGVVYTNDVYRFKFSLPDNWKGYSIISENLEIRDVQSGQVVATAPKILIRDPRWSLGLKREDIPVEIFTLMEWNKIQAGEYSVGAAPIPPSELGRNSGYVFALPARYNYDYSAGWQDVQQIIDSHPLSTF